MAIQRLPSVLQSSWKRPRISLKSYCVARYWGNSTHHLRRDMVRRGNGHNSVFGDAPSMRRANKRIVRTPCGNSHVKTLTNGAIFGA